MYNNSSVLEINDFVYLMLATLANNSNYISFNNLGSKYACLPSNYKQIIENILCESSYLNEDFSCLIDIESYFKNHFMWENRLSYFIKLILAELGKNIEYDVENDNLLIAFDNKEINDILNKYNDDVVKNKMSYFVELLNSYIYTREYQEKFYDHSADSVKKMRILKNK